MNLLAEEPTGPPSSTSPTPAFEQRGIEHVPDSERRGTPRQLGFLWSGVVLNVQTVHQPSRAGTARQPPRRPAQLVHAGPLGGAVPQILLMAVGAGAALVLPDATDPIGGGALSTLARARRWCRRGGR
ncbi:hypothetical protein GCM10022221_62310 [Actinocorallia aurea]